MFSSTISRTVLNSFVSQNARNNYVCSNLKLMLFASAAVELEALTVRVEHLGLPLLANCKRINSDINTP